MPYKTGKLKGKLTTAEIRKLVRAHNKLSKITIPPGSDRDKIINIISKSGFRVNHEQQRLEQTSKKDITLDKAKEATKIVPKTEAQKQQAKEKKEKKQKAVKSREGDLIKAGAIIGKARAKAQMKKQKPKPQPKEDEVRPKEKVGRPKIDPKKITVIQPKAKKALAIEDKPAKKGELKSQIREELTKVVKKYKGEDGGGKDNKYTNEGNNPIINNIRALKITKQGDQFKIITGIKTEKLLLDFVNKEFKNVPVVFDNLIFSTNNYDNGKQIPVSLVFQGKVMKGKGNAPAKKEDKGFKVEARERSQMINALSLQMKKKINPYKVLGITRETETPTLVKQRCRELRLKEHPDKGGDPVKFDLIQQVCKILLATETITKKKSGNDKENKIKELYTKLGYKSLPTPSQILDSEKLKKLKEKDTKLIESMTGKTLKEKISIRKEIDILKKEIDKQKKEERENPKKLSKDEKELLELMGKINMN